MRRQRRRSSQALLSAFTGLLSIIWLIVGVVGATKTNVVVMSFGFGLFLFFGWGSFRLSPSQISSKIGSSRTFPNVVERFFRRIGFTWVVGPPRSNDEEVHRRDMHRQDP
jgi:hypothetical protein